MTGDAADDAKKNGKDPVSSHSNSESQESQNIQGAPSYGGPYQPADFEHYSRFPVWTHLELACLSLGWDPNPLLNADLEALQRFPGELSKLEKRLHLIQSACDAQILSSPMAPLTGLAWLKSVDIEISAEFVSKCQRYSTNFSLVPFDEVKSLIGNMTDRMEAAVQKVQADNLGAHSSGAKQKVDSLQRMLLGMACDRYEYDPSKKRNPTAGMIAGATQLLGIAVDEGTIRTHLTAAAEKHLKD